MIFIRSIAYVLVLLVVNGCVSQEVRYKWQQRYGVPVGSTVTLYESLPVLARHTKVFIQDGRLAQHQGYQTGYNRFYPFCYFQTGRFSESEQIIEPDKFTVVSVRVEETQIVRSEPVLVASMGGDSSAYMVVELTIMTLVSAKQPDVNRLACAGGFQDIGEAEFPTIDEIEKVLGSLARLGRL